MDDGRKKDNPLVVILAVIGVSAFCIYVMSINPVFTKTLTLPYLKFQAGLYSAVWPGKYGDEYQTLVTLSDFLAQKNNAVLKINNSKLNDYITENTHLTSRTTRTISGLFLAVVLGLIAAMHYGRIKKRYFSAENISAASKPGVNGFVEVISPYIAPEEIEKVRKDPSPKNLADAFEIARQTINIPNAVVARLFPPFSEERLSLLEVGKKVRFNRDVLQIKQPTTGGVV